jgi:hypothetical protein
VRAIGEPGMLMLRISGDGSCCARAARGLQPPVGASAVSTTALKPAAAARSMSASTSPRFGQ